MDFIYGFSWKKESRQNYKEIKCKAKRKVAKAKDMAYGKLHERLDTKEREKDL